MQFLKYPNTVGEGADEDEGQDELRVEVDACGDDDPINDLLFLSEFMSCVVVVGM